MEEIRPKMVIGVLYLPLEKWSGHLLYQQHIESVEGLSIVTSYHISQWVYHMIYHKCFKVSPPPKSTTPGSGTLREVLDNDTTTRDKMYLNGLGVKKSNSISLSMMLKKVIEMAEYCTVFNYGPQITQRRVKFKDIMILEGKGFNPEQKMISPRE